MYRNMQSASYSQVSCWHSKARTQELVKVSVLPVGAIMFAKHKLQHLHAVLETQAAEMVV